MINSSAAESGCTGKPPTLQFATRILRSSLAPLSFAFAAVLTHQLSAADFTISSGQTETTRQTLDTGETGLIESGGTLQMTGDQGVYITGTGVQVTNHGIIDVTTNHYAVIGSATSDYSLENTGLIQTPWLAVWAYDVTNFINSGSILGTQQAVALHEVTGTLSNTGTIASDHRGLSIQTELMGTFFNSGSLISNSEIAFRSFETVPQIINEGLIDGGTQGINLATSSIGINVLQNSGDIHGDDRAIEAGFIDDLTNSGDITSDLIAIEITGGDIQELSNSGLIEGGDIAILSNDIPDLDNSGTIRGLAQTGLQLDAGSIVNSGTVEGGQTAIDAGEIISFDNSGTVTGGTGYGVRMDFGSVMNSGTIKGNVAILVDRDSTGAAHIVNSGRIESTAGPAGIAIDFQGSGDDTLELRQGSVIIGQINFGDGTDTLIVQPGLFLTLTVDTEPEIIEAGAALVVMSGNQLIIADKPNQMDSHAILASVTEGVGNTVVNRYTALRTTPVTGPAQQLSNQLPEPNYLIGADLDNSQSHQPEQAQMTRRGKRLWIDSFASYREKDITSAEPADIYKTGGFISGMDASINARLMAGAFVGAAHTRIRESETQRGGIDTYFGGLYGSYGNSSGSLDFSLTAGWSDPLKSGSAGTVNPASWFVSPEIGLERQLPVLGLKASLRGRYTAQFLDDYQSGFTQFSARDIHSLQGRLQIARPFHFTGESGKTSVATPYAGLDMSRVLDGENQEFSISGQTFFLTTNLQEKEWARFAGIRFSAALTDNFSVEAQFEGRRSDRETKSAIAKLGGSWKF